MATQQHEAQSLRAAANRIYAQPTAHPAEVIQENWLRNELETKHYIMGNVYGSHLPMQIRMECDILSQVQRLPGLTSSHVGIDTVLNRDTTIDFEDYLGDPRFSEYETDMRAALEKKFNVGPRPSLVGPRVGPAGRQAAMHAPSTLNAMPKDAC